MKKSRKKAARIIVRRASKLLARLKGAPAWISAGGGTINMCAAMVAHLAGCSFAAAHEVLLAEGWTSERLAAHLSNYWGTENVATLKLTDLFLGRVIFED